MASKTATQTKGILAMSSCTNKQGKKDKLLKEDVESDTFNKDLYI